MNTRDIHGVSINVRESGLAALLDEPEVFVLRHLQPARAKQTLCGERDGYTVESDTDGVTCPACLAEVRRRRAAKAITKSGRNTLRKLSAALKKAV